MRNRSEECPQRPTETYSKDGRHPAGPLRALLAVLTLLIVLPAHAERIKDLTSVRGVRKNQLIGYGLVMGLNGTGDSDKCRFTVQSAVAALGRMNVRVDAKGLKLKNVAAVMVTADLPAFGRQGNTLDVVISSTCDARSLVGGTLLATPLRGMDGEIYALAQGPVSVGGYSVASRGGNAEVKNHPTGARIPGGATIEREVAMALSPDQPLILQLNATDFTTAVRLAAVLNMELGAPYATALDGATVQLNLPPSYVGRPVELLAAIERLEVTPDVVARIVVNTRTGTVTMNENVRLGPAAIAHGSLTVTIKAEKAAVPAAPFTPGQTTIEENEELKVVETGGPIVPMNTATHLGEVIEALNRLGASPRDLVTILEALRASGSLRAEIVQI